MPNISQETPVKNTFIHFNEEADTQLSRSQSAPAILITEQKTEDREKIHPVITEQKTEDREKIHQKLKELIDTLNPTNGPPISFEQHLAEEFKKNPNDFDFSQFDFLRYDVSKFGLDQETFNSALASLDSMKKLYNHLKNPSSIAEPSPQELMILDGKIPYCNLVLAKHFIPSLEFSGAHLDKRGNTNHR